MELSPGVACWNREVSIRIKLIEVFKNVNSFIYWIEFGMWDQICSNRRKYFITVISIMDENYFSKD